jgi:hypothetical protein
MGNSCILAGHNYVLQAKTRVFSSTISFFWLGSTYSWQYEKHKCTKCNGVICYHVEGSAIDGPFVPGKIDPKRKITKKSPDEIIAQLSKKYNDVRWYTPEEIEELNGIYTPPLKDE